MTRARELSKLGNPYVFTVDSSNNLGIGSLTPDAKLDVTGIISATSFSGSGANLSGITAGATSALSSGYISLLKIGSASPTASEAYQMFKDEELMFTANSSCTLPATSASCTAIESDDVTDDSLFTSIWLLLLILLNKVPSII